MRYPCLIVKCYLRKNAKGGFALHETDKPVGLSVGSINARIAKALGMKNGQYVDINYYPYDGEGCEKLAVNKDGT